MTEGPEPAEQVGLVPSDEVCAHLARTLPERMHLAFEVLFALRADVQALDNALARWLADDGLTSGRMHVLVVLWAHKRPIPQSDIVRLLKVTRPTVSGLVDVLRTAGHVATAGDAADRRRMLVRLTPSGRRMVTRLARHAGERLRATFGALSDRELGSLVEVLGRLVRHGM